ncbi:MAG: cation transporter [Clostridia bacterium]|nr:cation transporter [Clostridia bacterium]
MKKSFKLIGLGCAICANKIQEAVSKLEGVNSATVNFAAAKLIIECDAAKIEPIVESAKAIIKKIEPGTLLQTV